MSEEEATTDRHDMREIERGAKTDDVRGAAAAEGSQAVGVDTKRGRKKPTGESHHKHVFGFVNESEDGTDIYIILTYSRMLNVGY